MSSTIGKIVVTENDDGVVINVTYADNPQPSRSGKTKLLASTGGFEPEYSPKG